MCQDVIVRDQQSRMLWLCEVTLDRRPQITGGSMLWKSSPKAAKPEDDWAFAWQDVPPAPPDFAAFSLLQKGHWSVARMLELEQKGLIAASRFDVTGLWLPTTRAASERSGTALYEPGAVAPEYYELCDRLLKTAFGDKAAPEELAKRIASVLVFLKRELRGLSTLAPGPRMMISYNDPLAVSDQDRDAGKRGLIVNGCLAIVVVPQDTVEVARQPDKAHTLIQAVVDFVNAVQRRGVYARHEMPAIAMQAYHADYYLAQVNNGGHSQFIRNAGKLLPTTSADALAGLEAMGARAHRQILSEMIAWAKANPKEAAAQNGFSVRADALDALDERFGAAERDGSMTALSAKWIAGWPELRAVAREQYDAEIERLAQVNPHLAPRRIWQSVQQLRFQMTNHFQITIAAACGAVKPEPETKLAVRAGNQMEIEGTPCMAFRVHTTKGMRVCVYEEAGGRLYEYIPRSPVPKPENLKLDDLMNFQPPVVGTRLSTVDAETIRRFVKVADDTLAPEAIDLLLRKATLDPGATITAWKLSDEGASWIVATGQTRTFAATLPNGAVLTKPDQTPILSVSREHIERHAKDAAAGGASLRPPA
jgi:hypothetical protein